MSLIQNEIRKEMERRKVGKDMQDFKRKQEEEKTKRLLEERNREKAEEKAARERVKQQIAMVTLSALFGRNTKNNHVPLREICPLCFTSSDL